MKKLIEFFRVYRMYRLGHSRVYAARIAYDIAFNGSAF